LPSAPQDTDVVVIERSGSEFRERIDAIKVAIGATSDISFAFSPANTNEDANNVASPGTQIATITTPASGSWTYALETVNGAYDGYGRVAIGSGANNNKIYRTGIPLDREYSASLTIGIVATRADPYLQVTVRLPLAINDVDEDGASPTQDYDFIAGVYTGGASLAQLGAVSGDVTSLGLLVEGVPVEHLLRNAMMPGQTGWSSGSGISFSTQAASGGFTPIDITDAGFGGFRQQTTARSFTAGEKVLLKVRFGSVAGDTTNKCRIRMTGAFSDTIDFDGTHSAPATQTGGTGASMTVVSKVAIDSTTTEVVLLFTATATGTLTIAVNARNAGKVRLWGAQAIVGTVDKAWRQSSTADTVPGFTPTLSGALLSLLQASAWTLALELNGNGYNHVVPGNILSSGATTGLENVALKMAGYTHVSNADGSEIATFCRSGFLGITRIVMARDGTDMIVAVNKDEPVTMSAPAAIGAVCKILGSNNGYVRRLSAWNSKLTNLAQLREISSITNRSFANIGQAFLPRPAFEVDKWTMTEDVIRINNSNGLNFTQSSFTDGANRYYQAGQLAANTMSNGKPKPLIPRYAFHNDPMGGKLQSINGEKQLFLDPQWMAAQAALGVDWGGYAPFTYPASVPGAKANSVLRINCQLTANLPASAQAVIPNEQQNSSSTALSTKWKWVSGCFTTGYGKIEYGKGHCVSFRMRFGSQAVDNLAKGGWGAGWLYTHSGNHEIDTCETNGGRPFRNNQAVHANNFGYNNSTNKDLAARLVGEFHNYQSDWREDGVYFGVSGLATAFMPMSAYASFQNTPQFLLGDYAIDPGNIWGQAPDATTDAAAPLFVDYDDICVDRTI
jgi:hypothetical protein